MVAREGVKALIGRDWLSQLQYEITPDQSEMEKRVMRFSDQTEMNEDGRKVSEKFPALFTRKGKMNKLRITTQFMQNMKPTQQRGRRVPIQLKEVVTEEIRRMLMMGQIVKVDTIKEDVFIHPTVITVKKDRSVRIAIDTRKMNESMVTNTNYLPIVEKSVDQTRLQKN